MTETSQQRQWSPYDLKAFILENLTLEVESSYEGDTADVRLLWDGEIFSDDTITLG